MDTMRLVVSLLFIFTYMVTAPGFTAEKKLEIIELQHRSVNDLMPVLKPLLGPEDRISGSGNQLIFTGSHENLEQLKKIVAKIDKPLTQLKVTIQYARKSQLSNSTHIASTRSDDDQYSTQQIQVTEGRWASFDIGKLVPDSSANLQLFGINTGNNNQTTYKKITSGFYVLAELQNDRIKLKIAPYYSKLNTFDQRNIDRLSAKTEVSGKPGQWIMLGGTTVRVTGDPSVEYYSTRQAFADDRQLWVKVDKLDENN